MTTRSRTHWLLPLLALCITIGLATTALAQTSTSASLQISFGSRPHWSNVSGTGVRSLRDGEGPGYDMFRYGGNYYAYNNNQWYRSHSQTGQYAPIDQRSVPGQLRRVPRNKWRHYPTDWAGQPDNSGHRGSGRDHH